MARGGYRQPAKPAAVSGPGRASQRTDGGPGNAAQPIRVATGQGYGEAGPQRDAQRAIPLEAVNSPTAPTSPGSPPAPMPSPEGVFGPTTRPNESPMAGLPPMGAAGQGPPPINVDDQLRALYSVFPHPQLLKLIHR